jgi:hypothetical protein
MGIPNGYTSGQVVQAVPSLSAYAVTSSTRPASPFDGQIISETDTDTLQIYKGSAWGSPNGFIPIAPTSVTVGSGTGTASSNGVVTFTGATTVLLNGIFSSSYTNYRIVFQGYGVSNANNMRGRISLAGSVVTTGTYTSGFIAVDYSSSASWTFIGGGGGTFAPMGWIDNGATTANALAFDIYNPAVAVRTYWNGFTTGTNGGTANAGGIVMGMHETTTAYDGWQFFNSAGTNMTGTVSVFGYVK